MFSPDELLNSGSSLVYYYGHDIYGNKLTTTPTLASFFEEGSNRDIAPYNPTQYYVFINILCQFN